MPLRSAVAKPWAILFSNWVAKFAIVPVRAFPPSTLVILCL